MDSTVDHFQNLFNLAASNKNITKLSPEFLFIGELAKQLDLNPKTIRFYEDEGLISPKRHGAFRTFVAADVERLKTIISLRQMGINIATIKALFKIDEHDSAKRFMISSFRQHRENLEKQKNTIESQLHETAHLIAKLEETPQMRAAS